jgi:hypothetical protein
MVSFFLAFNIANAFLHKRRSEQTILKEHADSFGPLWENYNKNFKDAFEELHKILAPNDKGMSSMAEFKFDEFGWVPRQDLTEDATHNIILEHAEPMLDNIETFKSQVVQSNVSEIKKLHCKIVKTFGLPPQLIKIAKTDSEDDVKQYKKEIQTFLNAVALVAVAFRNVLGLPQDVTLAQNKRKDRDMPLARQVTDSVVKLMNIVSTMTADTICD